MIANRVTIRPAKSSSWMLFLLGVTWLSLGIYLLAIDEWPEFAALPFLGVLALVVVWYKYHRGNPAWMIIDEEGLSLPMVRPGSIPWHQIEMTESYHAFRDSGIRVKFNRYLSSDGSQVLIPNPSSNMDEHSSWVKASLINCDFECSCNDLADAINTIRSSEGADRFRAIERLRTIV
jgi:hypothetical protein